MESNWTVRDAARMWLAFGMVVQLNSSCVNNADEATDEAKKDAVSPAPDHGTPDTGEESDSGPTPPDMGLDGDAQPDEGGADGDTGAADAGPDACVPDCAGKECGSDGCGKSCGTCGPDTDGVCTAGTCGVKPPPDEPFHPDGTPCDDGNPCTKGDTCGGGKCQSGPEDDQCCQTDADCGIGGGCGCSGASGVVGGMVWECTSYPGKCEDGKCKVEQEITSCDDNDPETDDDCGSETGCLHKPKPCVPSCASKECGDDGCGGSCGVCNDKNVCTTDLCSSGKCTYKPCSAFCDDGNPCTTNDSCAGGVCVGLGNKSCDDGNSCTKDSCVSGAGACQNEAIANCCNAVTSCPAGHTCENGVCDDGFADVWVKWPVEYLPWWVYYVSLQAWYCQGGVLVDDAKAESCTSSSEWKEWLKWGENDPDKASKLFSVEGGFKLPHGSWFFFNPVFNTSPGGPLADWCDSIPSGSEPLPNGFSSGVLWLVWADGVQLTVKTSPNGFTGCNGRVWIP